MTMRKMLTVAAVAALGGSAHASTPAAWDQMNQRANRACVAMSGLSRPLLLAKKISFSDVIGVEIRQLWGVDSRGRMKRLLCAYNRSSGRAEIQEGDNWLGPTTKP
jgi:hypothetical protein